MSPITKLNKKIKAAMKLFIKTEDPNAIQSIIKLSKLKDEIVSKETK